VKEMVKPVAENRSMLVVGISRELEKQLERVKELVAQSSSKPCNLEQALEQMAALFLERKDPLQRAERITQRKLAAETKAKPTSLSNVGRPAAKTPSVNVTHLSKQTASANVAHPVSKTASTAARQTRSPIPAAIRHQVMLRDRGECQGTTPNGARCGCRQWTDIHHIRPISFGGTNHLGNLLTLCRSHHREVHRR